MRDRILLLISVPLLLTNHIEAFYYNHDLVPLQVLQPEDMVNPNVDELSMMTYLSQFPEAELKPGAPIKTISKGDPSKVKVFGPGVERCICKCSRLHIVKLIY